MALLANRERVVRTSYATDANHLRERATEMRGSSKQLKDNDTAAVLMRLADLYDRLAARAEAQSRSAEVMQTELCDRTAVRQG
jgi:hypothetical protein